VGIRGLNGLVGERKERFDANPLSDGVGT
jgi:hypothetical protein